MSSIDPTVSNTGNTAPQRFTAEQITKQSQEDLNSILQKDDGISGASALTGSQSAEEIRTQSQKDLESVQNSKGFSPVGNAQDSVTLSPLAVSASEENPDNDNLDQDSDESPLDSNDIEANAKQYLQEYNDKSDLQVDEDQEQATTESKLKSVFGKDLSDNQLNGYRNQMKTFFGGVDLFATGNDKSSSKSNSFANFTDTSGNLRDINGYMNTLERVKTDNPSARITSAANLQDYARDHYDDDMNFVKEGNAENTFGEERHQQAKSLDSKSEEFSFKDHLSQVGRDIYKERYSRTDTDESQGVKETKEDNTLGTSQTSFLNTITQNMASDVNSFTQYDFADIQTASQDLNDDITSSDTTYAVSGTGQA